MNFRFFLAVALCLLLCFAGPSALQADQWSELQEILQQCHGAYLRLVDYRGLLRHEVWDEGEPIREDEIEAVFRKPSFLSLQWQSGMFKGTRLVSRPSWNRGNLHIQLGGWFDFLTLGVPATEVSEPFVPGVKDLSEWLTALSMLAQRSTADRSLRQVELRTRDPNLAEGHVLILVPAFLVPFRDNSVSMYEFMVERGTGMPKELILRGAGGAIRQRVSYRELQVNVGVPTQSFEWEENTEIEKGLPHNEVEIDVRGFIQNWQRRYLEISDYVGEWKLEERRNETLLQNFATFKFRKPFDVYLIWRALASGRREALFRQGWNDGRVRVRTTFWGVPLIGDLEPDRYLARWGYRHPLTEFGLNGVVEILQTNLLQAWLRGELGVRFRGLQNCFESIPCYALEFNFSQRPDNADSPARVVIYWDIAARLPVKYEEFDGADRLQERQEFQELRTNIDLRDIDFDAANPAYGFLLFPHAPQLDRFLTGRE